MEIIDHKDYSLTNFTNMNNNKTSVTSDHAPMRMDVKLEAFPVRKTKIELHNFEDKESQIKFKKQTSDTNIFTNCFNTLQSVSVQSEKWLSHINTYIKRSFKKIRIRPKKMKPSSADWMINKRNKMVKKSMDTINIDALIAKTISEEGRKKSLMFGQYRNKSGVMSHM